MSKLLFVGYSMFVLSIWAVIQLTIMGVLFKMENFSLIESAEAHAYKDYDEFIKKTKESYSQIANNCWIAACMYFLLIAVSFGFIYKGKQSEKKKAEKYYNVDIVCVPPQRL